jgi:hypothetical protein
MGGVSKRADATAHGGSERHTQHDLILAPVSMGGVSNSAVPGGARRTMSELAYDQNGDRILLPAQATHFLVRCFPRPGTRGAPRICLDRNGSQLKVPVEQPVSEFSEKVDGRPGRYRLDPCDEHGRIVPNVPPAYFTISDQTRNGESGGGDERDSVIRDLARANADMTKSISERFASVMQATADLLRVTASIPPRPMPVLPPDPDDDDDDDDDDDSQEDEDDDRDERRDIAGLLAELLPTLQLWLSARAADKAAASAAATPAGPSPAAPSPVPPPASAPEPAAASPTPPRPSDSAATSSTSPPPASPTNEQPTRNSAITPAQIAHLTAIQARLTPQEVRVVQAAALRMTPPVRAEWLAELAARSVDDAVTLVRSMLPKLRADSHPEAES